MTITDAIAILALVISSGSLFLEFRRWFDDKPRIKISFLMNMKVFPAEFDDGKEKFGVTVVNRGSVPTTITHVCVYHFKSRWHRKPTYQGVVMQGGDYGQPLPFSIEPNSQWNGRVLIDEELRKSINKECLYVGVLCNHSDKPTYSKVPKDSVALDQKKE